MWGVRRVGDAIHPTPPPPQLFAHRSPTSKNTKTQRQVEANIARCPDPATAEQMIARIDEIRKTGNSVGGASERNRDEGVGLGCGCAMLTVCVFVSVTPSVGGAKRACWLCPVSVFGWMEGWAARRGRQWWGVASVHVHKPTT